MSHALFAVGQRTPVPVVEGLRISGPSPLVIMIGIPRPTLAEIKVIDHGAITHRFGWNAATAWLTLHLFDQDRNLEFRGELFHSAGKQPDEFTDAALARMRDDLPEGYGTVCSVVLVDTVNQTVRALRAYSWSNALSLAFLEAAETTRHASPAEADRAADVLLRRSTDELAAMATVTFSLPGYTPTT